MIANLKRISNISSYFTRHNFLKNVSECGPRHLDPTVCLKKAALSTAINTALRRTTQLDLLMDIIIGNFTGGCRRCNSSRQKQNVVVIDNSQVICNNAKTDFFVNIFQIFLFMFFSITFLRFLFLLLSQFPFFLHLFTQFCKALHQSYLEMHIYEQVIN